MRSEITVEVHQELEGLLPGFLDNRRRDLGALADCLAQRDFGRIATIAHNMRGAGSAYGFDQVSALGTRLGEAAAAQDLDDLGTCIAEYRDFLGACRVVFV